MTPEALALKQATGEMIKGVGGIEAAANFCRVGKSVLSDNQSRNKPDSFVALDVIADLEPLARERSGWPHVTRRLARSLGFELVRTPEGAASGADLFAIVAQHAQVHADILRALTQAVTDGSISPVEARAIRAEIAAAQERLAALDAELVAIENGGDE